MGPESCNHALPFSSLDRSNYNYITFALQDGVVLSLPVMINDIEKDLIIYEDDDSTEAVLAFCSENMSDEADKCADHFLGVVRDKLADYVTQISE